MMNDEWGITNDEWGMMNDELLANGNTASVLSGTVPLSSPQYLLSSIQCPQLSISGIFITNRYVLMHNYPASSNF
jgi:hypothetical protein